MVCRGSKILNILKLWRLLAQGNIKENLSVILEDQNSCGFLKQMGTVVKTADKWLLHVFKMSPEILSSLAALRVLILSVKLTSCSAVRKDLGLQAKTMHQSHSVC